MTPQHVPERFERIMVARAQGLNAWLPVALLHAEIKVESSARQAHASFPDGALTICWQSFGDGMKTVLRLPARFWRDRELNRLASAR